MTHKNFKDYFREAALMVGLAMPMLNSGESKNSIDQDVEVKAVQVDTEETQKESRLKNIVDNSAVIVGSGYESERALGEKSTSVTGQVGLSTPIGRLTGNYTKKDMDIAVSDFEASSFLEGLEGEFHQGSGSNMTLDFGFSNNSWKYPKSSFGKDIADITLDVYGGRETASTDGLEPTDVGFSDKTESGTGFKLASVLNASFLEGLYLQLEGNSNKKTATERFSFGLQSKDDERNEFIGMVGIPIPILDFNIGPTFGFVSGNGSKSISDKTPDVFLPREYDDEIKQSGIGAYLGGSEAGDGSLGVYFIPFRGTSVGPVGQITNAKDVIFGVHLDMNEPDFTLDFRVRNHHGETSHEDFGTQVTESLGASVEFETGPRFARYMRNMKIGIHYRDELRETNPNKSHLDASNPAEETQILDSSTGTLVGNPNYIDDFNVREELSRTGMKYYRTDFLVEVAKAVKIAKIPFYFSAFGGIGHVTGKPKDTFSNSTRGTENQSLFKYGGKIEMKWDF